MLPHTSIALRVPAEVIVAHTALLHIVVRVGRTDGASNAGSAVTVPLVALVAHTLATRIVIEGKICTTDWHALASRVPTIS